MSCGHLLGKGGPLGSRLWCLTVSLSLSHWYPGIRLFLCDDSFVPCFVVLFCVSSGVANILMGNFELVALLCMSSWCLVIVIVLWLFICSV